MHPCTVQTLGLSDWKLEKGWGGRDWGEGEMEERERENMMIKRWRKTGEERRGGPMND